MPTADGIPDSAARRCAGYGLLPSLSAAFAKGMTDRYNALLDWGLKLVVAFAVPAAIGLARSRGRVGVRVVPEQPF